MGQDIIFLPCSFYLLSSFYLFFSPNFNGRRLDVYHTSTHDVPLVRIYNAGLTCAASGSLEIQDAKMTQKSPSEHHRTTLSGYIFATKACIVNRKKNVSSNISSRCPIQYGELRRTDVWNRLAVWGTPPYFNGYRVFAALLHGTLLLGVSQTVRRWTEGAIYIRQGGHHVGHWPTFLVVL